MNLGAYRKYYEKMTGWRKKTILCSILDDYSNTHKTLPNFHDAHPSVSTSGQTDSLDASSVSEQIATSGSTYCTITRSTLRSSNLTHSTLTHSTPLHN